MSVSEKLSFILELRDADKVSKGLRGVSDDADKAGRKAESSFEKMSSGALKAGTAGLAFAGVMGAALFKAGQAASDVAEATNKTMVLFGSSGQAMVRWAETADKAMGMSKVAALDAAGTFGNLFRGVGDTAELAASKSQEFVKLAGDLASFHNANPADVITALGAALRGESEPARQFGILLDDVTLKQRAMQMGLGDFTSGTLPQAIKVQAAYAEILAQSKSAQDDFSETSGGLANQQRILKAEMQNAVATIGEGVLPVMSKVVSGVGDAIDMFKALPPELQKGIGGFLAFGTAGIAAVSAIATIVGVIGKAQAAMASLNASLMAANPILLGVAGVAAIAGAALFAYTHDKIEARKRTDEFVKALKDEEAGLKGATDALIAKSLGDLADKAAKLGLTVGDLAKVIKGETVPAYEALNKQAEWYTTNSGSADKAAVEAGKTALDLTRSVGKLEKAHASATQEIAKQEKANQQAKVAADALGLTEEQLALKTGETTQKQKDAKAAAEDLEKATKERTKAVEDSRKALEDALRAEQNMLDAQLSAINGEIGLRASHKATQDAVKELAKANKDDLAEAVDKAASAAITEATNFAKVQDDMAKANGETLTAGQRQDMIAKKLGEVAATLDPNSPLRVQLEEYIGRLQAIPTKVSTLVELQAIAKKSFASIIALGGGDNIDPTELANAAGIPAFADGGTVPGATGEPQMILAHGGEQVLTVDEVRSRRQGWVGIDADNYAVSGEVARTTGSVKSQGGLTVILTLDGMAIAKASYPYLQIIEREHL